MKKLTLRLLVLILSVYLAGSIYPLLAHEPCPGRSSAPPPPPARPAPPVKVPEAPPMLDTKRQQGPPPPLDTFGEPTTRGCGGPLTDTYTKADDERKAWRKNDFNVMANEKINKVKEMANTLITSIREDIKKAQSTFHECDELVKDFETNAPAYVGAVKDVRKRSWEQLQHQKGRLEKAEDWRHQKIGEIQALQDRAKNGDYLGYRGLKDFDYSIPHGLLK
jgi:hypothetical protein